MSSSAAAPLRKSLSARRKRGSQRKSVVDGDVRKQGHLQKRSTKAISGRWQRRYFTLAGHYLSYRDSEASAQAEASKASIDLKSIERVSRAKTEIKLRERNHGEVFRLKASSENEAEAWLFACSNMRRRVAGRALVMSLVETRRASVQAARGRRPGRVFRLVFANGFSAPCPRHLLLVHRPGAAALGELHRLPRGEARCCEVVAVVPAPVRPGVFLLRELLGLVLAKLRDVHKGPGLSGAEPFFFELPLKLYPPVLLLLSQLDEFVYPRGKSVVLFEQLGRLSRPSLLALGKGILLLLESQSLLLLVLGKGLLLLRDSLVPPFEESPHGRHLF